MTTRTSSFIKSDSRYHRISKQMGAGGGDANNEREREMDDEKERQGGGEWRRCVCA